MPAKLIWEGQGAKALVKQEAVRWLVTGCTLTVNKAKELLSVPGTGKVRGKKAGPVVRSRPGEPPRKQTGRGRASVTYEVDEKTLAARAGTNVGYMAALERGTRRGLRPRPWLRPAFEWAKSQLKP